MPITAQQREDRRRTIGSSDAAAICGLDPFRSPADVFLSKTCDIEDTTNPAIEAGNRLEPVLLDYAQEKIGSTITPNVHVEHPDGILAVNLDGVVDETEAIVECKTTGMADEWGEPGTDAVPDRVIIQTQFQMYVAGSELAWVPVLLGKFGLRFQLYQVERDENLGEMIAERCRDFHSWHVAKGVCPTDSTPSLEVAKRIRREPNKVVTIRDEIVRAWTEAKDKVKAAQKAQKDAEAVLLATMGDAEAADCGLGRVAYLEIHRKGYTAKPSTYRRLSLRKAKDIQ